jgi:hypothetical protein
VPNGFRRPLALAIVLVTSASYLAYVFRFAEGTFWTTGAGDWIDPYFINALLEHWYRSATTMADPSSPPMYFPVAKTLGYSHGLVLYAPFYVLCRLFLHPFQAYNLTLLLVLEAGILCLYLLLRKFYELSFVESLLLSGFFFSSRNVINGGTGVWSQRASVFLIPPILCILLWSVRSAPGRFQFVLAGLGGLLATLLFTQDFYTGQFALLFVVLLLPALLLIESRTPLGTRLADLWNADRRPAARAALVVLVLSTVWTCYALLYGGGTVQILGMRITSHDWWRPALVAFAALAAFLGMRGGIRAGVEVGAARGWLFAFGIGAAAGCAAFAWIYFAAYREHRVFPEEQLINQLVTPDPAHWGGVRDAVNGLNAYDAIRTFALVFVLAALALIPSFGVDRKARRYLVWLVAVSVLVLLIPLRFNEFSIWRTVFEPLPGFAVIRDPKRVIPLYELTATLVVAFVLTRVRERSPFRVTALVLLCVLLVTNRNPERFDFLRPIAVFARWVDAPIAVDPSCRSFFIKPASAEYRSRSDNVWSLYALDSFFVALNHSLPTLNGYSAWYPQGWTMTDPEDRTYSAAVREWAAAHGLSGVCQLDIEARTLKP